MVWLSIKWCPSANSTVCCQAGNAQAVQQASVHPWVAREKLLPLTVLVPMVAQSIVACPVCVRDWCEAWLKGCCASDLPCAWEKC